MYQSYYVWVCSTGQVILTRSAATANRYINKLGQPEGTTWVSAGNRMVRPSTLQAINARGVYEYKHKEEI
jgi:hypothetical protein